MGVDFSLRVSRVRLAPEGRSSRDAIGSTLRGVLQNLKDRIFVTFNKQLHHNPISHNPIIIQDVNALKFQHGLNQNSPRNRALRTICYLKSK